MTTASSIGNPKYLTRLAIYYSNLTTQTLQVVANIGSLKFFTIESCGCLLGQLPSTTGNMSNLERLDISGRQLSGPIPHEVGALKKLKSLTLSYNGLSGRIPNATANLTQLTELLLEGNCLSGMFSSLSHKSTPSFCRIPYKSSLHTICNS
jgi:hypothetical protein